MLYFVKDGKLHRYPMSRHCSVRYEAEHLQDYVPQDVEGCIYCMRRWPDEEQ